MREGEGPMTDLADRLRATGSEACADYARLYAEGSLGRALSGVREGTSLGRKADAALTYLLDELERAQSWEGALDFIDRTYPSNIFTGESGDPGPRLIVLLRELKQAEATIESLKCCGNCCLLYVAYDGQTFCDAPANDDDEESVELRDHCHFTPSRWERRDS